MAEYKLKYHCEKCDKDFYVNLNGPSELSPQDLERFTNEFKQEHESVEHTHCARCNKKLSKEERKIRIVGFEYPKPEEMRNGYMGRLLSGFFCDECNKALDEKEKEKTN